VTDPLPCPHKGVEDEMKLACLFAIVAAACVTSTQDPASDRRKGDLEWYRASLDTHTVCFVGDFTHATMVNPFTGQTITYLDCTVQISDTQGDQLMVVAPACDQNGADCYEPAADFSGCPAHAPHALAVQVDASEYPGTPDHLLVACRVQ
jgi:hypothetical protein